MTRGNAPISTDPLHRIEELFVEMFQADSSLDAYTIVAGSDRDAVVPPLHAFVLCREVTPLMQTGQNYFADVVVGVASNLDDSNHTERKAFTKLVLNALTRTEPSYATADARLLSWAIKQISESSDGQNTGDIIVLRVAAWVSAPA